MIPVTFAVVLVIATLIWAKLIDHKRQYVDSSYWRFKGIPLTHHIFEMPANLFVGYEVGLVAILLYDVVDFPIWKSILILFVLDLIGSICLLIAISKGANLFGLKDTTKRNTIALTILNLFMFIGVFLGLTFPL